MPNHEKDREQLREIQAIFEKAVTENQIEKMKDYCAPEFSFVSFSDKAFSDFETFATQWQKTRASMVGNGHFKTNLEPEPALFINDIAVCRGNSKNEMIDKKGQHFVFTSNWTVVFQNIDNEWKILRAHNSLNPFSNPMLNNAVKKSILKLGLSLFIAGAVVCSALTYLILT